MQPNPKLHPGNPSELKDAFNISDPYIDNLAQLVVGKDSSSSPKRLVDMLVDPNVPCEDIDDFPLEVETNSSKKNLSSPVVMKSPEIPPGAYVPRTSMNVAQPNVRLGPGPAYGGGGSEQAMLYGGYPGHPSESAMMDYINMSAIHYFHNHSEAMAGYDLPWKLLLLEVPIKIPYPLMVIETQELGHKYTDPRLKGHPSVLNSTSSTDSESMLHQNSYDFNCMSTFGTQLASPNFMTTTSSEFSETLTPLMNDFLPKSDEPESPMFPIGDDLFSFKHKIDTDEFGKKISDRSYLQDPRFKRKKVIVSAAMESGMEME